VNVHTNIRNQWESIMSEGKRRVGRRKVRTDPGEFVSIRIPGELKARLVAAADAGGRSISAEGAARLDRTFIEQDARQDAAGGPDMQPITMIMSGAFLAAGKGAAVNVGHPEWTTRQWLADGYCVSAAILAAYHSLWLIHPNPSPEQKYLCVQSLLGRVASEFANDPAALAGLMRNKRGKFGIRVKSGH
jgi:hypothetical protein